MNDQLQRMRELLSLDKSFEEQKLNEAFWSGLKGAVQGAVNGFRSGADLSGADKAYKAADDIFNKMYQEVSGNAKLFSDLNNARNQINSLNLDQHTKEAYTDKINGILNVQKEVSAILQKHKTKESTAEAGDQAQAAQQTAQGQTSQGQTQSNTQATAAGTQHTGQTNSTTAGAQQTQAGKQTWSNPGNTARAKGQASQHEYTPYEDVTGQQPAANGGKQLGNAPKPLPNGQQKLGQQPTKVFNMNSAQSEIDSFLKNRKMVAESHILTEAVQQESKFKEAFTVLFQNAGKMSKAVGGKYDADSLAHFMQLAFKSILDKGQGRFIDDIKEINNGYNTYRAAYKNLHGQQQQNGQQGQDRTAEAKQVAEEFLKAHGYQITPEALEQATQYIMNHQHF